MSSWLLCTWNHLWGRKSCSRHFDLQEKPRFLLTMAVLYSINWLLYYVHLWFFYRDMSKCFLWKPTEGLNECRRHWRHILHMVLLFSCVDQHVWTEPVDVRCCSTKNKNASHHSVSLCIDNLTNSREGNTEWKKTTAELV